VRPAAGVLLVGIVLMMVQGAVNAFVPAHFVPNVGLLVVVGVGLHWRSAAAGVAITALLGFAADLLSGSLLGEQALLGFAVFAAARLSSQQLNLRGALPQAVFVLALVCVHALGTLLLDGFFGARTAIAPWMLRVLPIYAAVNAIFAPVVIRGVGALAAALGKEEGVRRQVRLPGARRAA
jgi:rod shape-determining protein MreD